MKPSDTKKEKKKSTVSMANTPVQRALSRSNRYILLALFIVGMLFGFLYKIYFHKPVAQKPPDAAIQQR